ncbi:acetyltransferase [Chitinophaga tropicalis]|uniref:Acetyltransferase n=1 Tax=Chitinophaga tropicalis TaxID=2683588 RepID=A0A7K1U3L3_9BACT|nr:acetyltransferase [Chitinophaga tropicalis]MVT08876.1 acetyltransferase [Chitinophaga tropicalis]
MKQIAIYGAGGFGREVKMLIDQINDVNSKHSQLEFVGFYDDGMEKGHMVNGYPVLGGTIELNSISEDLGIVVAVGNPKAKKNIIGNLTNKHIWYPVLIHPSVFIGRDDVTIGEGSIICAGCLITVNIRIGRHVILNLGCTVGHDTVIGDYSSFMPSVNISGEVNIAECVYGGTGAKIINRSDIGEETTIGMGAIVAKSLPPKCTAVGIPAKPVKFHD